MLHQARELGRATTGEAAVRRARRCLLALLLVAATLAGSPPSAGAAVGDLVMVTGSGGFGSGDDAVKRSFFESLGWTVTAIDDSSSAGSYAAAAAANDVMYLSDTVADAAAVEGNLPSLDIGLVVEKFGPKFAILYSPTSNESFVNETQVNIVDDTHYITRPFGAGSRTIYSTSSDLNYWNAATNPLPAGVDVLAERVPNSDHEALYAVDTGAALYGANTAPNRRVFIPSDFAGYANWASDYRTIVERSLDWAAGLEPPTSCSVDSDGDGLWDCEEDANTDLDDDPGTSPGPDTDGDTIPNYLDADDDGDGTPTAAENADPNADGDPRDAVDGDRDGEPDYLDVPHALTVGLVASTQKISDLDGGLAMPLVDSDRFGFSTASIGDIDGDGAVDLAVGLQFADDGGTSRGAVAVLFMNADGTVEAEQRISDTAGGLSAPLDDFDLFGQSVAGLGDVDGDGIGDVAVGASGDDDVGSNRGAVYVLLLHADGTVKAEQKISDTAGGFTGVLDDFDLFGSSVGALGDLDGDGVVDLAVGATGDDDGGTDRGAVYVLLLNADGTVKAEQKISDTSGGFGGVLADSVEFGRSVSMLGDVDGDGVGDLAVGAWFDADGGANSGAVFVTFLNADGTVKAEQRVSASVGGLAPGTIDPGDLFGWAVSGVGDLDGNGVPDLVVGAGDADDGGNQRGAVHVLSLAVDGTVVSQSRISSTSGGLPAVLVDGDKFGSAVAGIGDLDGDGTVGLVVGAFGDDDGGFQRGAVHVLDLDAPCPDADGDGLCDVEEDANTDADNDPATSPGPDTDGDTVPNYLDADDDGDGTPTASENADPNADGDPRDALDSDRDGEPDWLDAPISVPTDGTVAAEQKISDTAGGLAAILDDSDLFGYSVSGIGDVDGDGVTDVAVGAYGDDDGASFAGAVYVLFMNADGTVKAEQKISSTAGGLVGPLDGADLFGTSVAGVGDIDGDGVNDIAVGARMDDDGGLNRGAVYVLFLHADGSVKGEQKISDTAGGFGAVLDDVDAFGGSVSGVGDLDGDGVNDIVVGAKNDDDGNTSAGAVYVLFLNADGSVKAEQKISDTAGGLVESLGLGDNFGSSVTGAGDLDGDGVNDIATGAAFDGDGGSGRGAVYVLFLNTDGTVKAEQKISDTAGGFGGVLDDDDRFGVSVAGVGDADGDGVSDIVAGVYHDDDGGVDRGAVYVLFLNTDGTVKAEQKVSSTTGGLAGPLDDSDIFGTSVASLGDVNGDGAIDIMVGAFYDDDGGADRGAAYVLNLSALVDHCAVDSDSDGLWDCEEDANTDADGDPATNPGPDTDGDAVPNYLDADDDGDGAPTASESADPNGDGDPRDAVDSDRDGQPDWLDAPITAATDGTVGAEQKISDLAGGLTAVLDDTDYFGRSVTGVGDLDGDGINDVAVGAYADDDGGLNRGAIHILFLNADGTVKAEQKISDTAGGLSVVLDDSDFFGYSIAGVGDLDGDGVSEVIVGARGDDDGGGGRGAVYVLFLNADGTVKAEQKISDTAGGLSAVFDDFDLFGMGVTGLGDVDGDGINDVAVGADGDDDGGSSRGAVYVLFLNADGTVKAEQKISSAVGGLTGPLDDSDFLGPVAGTGDIDGDGVNDLIVGASGDDDGGTSRGAVYVLFLNADGTVKAEQKISDTAGGLSAVLDDSDFVGYSVAGAGDLDGDGIADVAVGSYGDSDGGSTSGAAYLLFLNADGTVRAEQKLSSTAGGLAGPLADGDRFSSSIAGLGDLDGDGAIDVAVGAFNDDDGGTDRGAVYVLNLSPPGCPAVDSDGDGLWDCEEDANTDADGDPATSPGPDADGDTIANYLDADDDGDGIPTASENADPNADGDPRDALDVDRDGQPDYLDLPMAPTSLDIETQTKVSSTQGGLVGPIDNSDQLASSLTSVGDVDGDGVVDLAVGAILDDDGGSARGAVYVLFMNADGTVRAEQKISSTQGGFVGPLDDVDYFGTSVTGLGDIDGDGIPDLAVGVYQDDDGGSAAGAVYVLFLDRDGTVKAEQKISPTTGGLVGPIDVSDSFGASVATPGDLDGDGLNDLVVGAEGDDDGASGNGAVYVLFLNADGTVRAEQKISDTQGGLTSALGAGGKFGSSATGLGDLDGDGVPDLAVGSYFDGDGGSTRGAVYVLRLNADGTVKADQKISDTQGGLDFALADIDWFGIRIAGLGDLDGDAVPDLAVGAYLADDGGNGRGRVHLLLLNADGTVKAEDTLSSISAPSITGLDNGDQFGSGLAAIGDFDDDGTIGLAVGARDDDDGGSSRGAFYLFDLEAGPASLKVNSTGDAPDLATGDGRCDTGGVNADGLTECTLRAAMEEANASADLDEITFWIPDTDPNRTVGLPSFWTISPASALPAATDIIAIDATTQPGWSSDGPIVALDGSSAPASTSGLFPGAGLTIRGLSFTAWDHYGVLVGSDDVTIQASWLGVSPDGTVAANGLNDVLVYGTSSNFVFGGPGAADGNVVTAAGVQDGVALVNTASNAVIENNFFGVASDGVTALGSGATEFVIVTDDVSGVVVRNNQFGDSTNGAIVIGSNATDVEIVGNIFGTDAGGAASLPVGQAVYSDSSGSFVFGGTDPGDGNLVRNTLYDGLSLGGTFTGTATVLGNSIAGSGALGIDIAGDGPTVNDPGDVTPGPNGTLNHPEVLQASTAGGVTTVEFELDVAAGDYRVELFANPSGADPSGYGEGELFVGATLVTHGGSGAELFEVDVPDQGSAPLSLTATRSLGGGSYGPTSEFSPVAVAGAPVVVEDLSPRQSDVVASGGADPVGAVAGVAADGFGFDGGPARLVGPPTDISTAELSISVWVDPDSLVGDPRLVSKGVGADLVYELLVDGSTGEAVARLDIGGAPVEVRGGSITTGSWHHVVVSWDGSGITLFVDGAAVDIAVASGALAIDLDQPLVLANTDSGLAGFDGRLDQVEIHHRSMSAAEVSARQRNGSDPTAHLTLGGEQTAAPAPWTTSGVEVRSGANALAAPDTIAGADAWITAIGLDEPGVEMSAWWWVSDPGASVVAAGTRTGGSATNQFDAEASVSGLGLAVIDGAARTLSDTDTTVLPAGSWRQIVMSTDELGSTSFAVDGATLLGPSALVGGASGSVGFRAGDIDPGEQWFIDDVRVRRFVSDEPTTSFGPIEVR